MQITTNKYLNKTSFFQLESWSVQALLESKVLYNPKFVLARIGDFLTKSREIINIDNAVEYKRITIRIRNGGVLLRDTEIGVNIGTKKQFLAHSGQFIVSKIDARNGAFGIVPSDLEGAIVTNDFPLFDVNEARINPEFLVLITTTKQFIKFAQSCSSGTTNRQRMDIDLFLNQKIPLPTIAEQEKIVNAYNQEIARAKFLEDEATNLEDEIEKYFLRQLGLEPFSLKKRISGLQTTNYLSLDRWDFFSTDSRIAIELRKSKIKLTTIGQSFNFPKRSWNKANHEKATFKYIEIGAIDPSIGIIEAKEISTKNAPSRATQIVKEGDLILGTTRPYLKKFAIVPAEFDENICSSGFSIIEPSSSYYLPFLLQFLKCSYGVEQLKNKMTGGLYPAITEQELKEITIPFPTVDKQQEIMELIEQKRKNILENMNLLAQIKDQVIKNFEAEIFG